MNEQRIREIAGQCSDFAEQIPFYRGVEDGLTWEAKILKARDFKFAELIVGECIGVVNKRYMGDNNREDMEVRRCVEDVKKHFGVEE